MSDSSFDFNSILKNYPQLLTGLVGAVVYNYMIGAPFNLNNTRINPFIVGFALENISTMIGDKAYDYLLPYISKDSKLSSTESILAHIGLSAVGHVVVPFMIYGSSAPISEYMELIKFGVVSGLVSQAVREYMCKQSGSCKEEGLFFSNLVE